MKIVAFVPAKGSSERIGNKNIKLLDGKPLFLYTLEKLVSCDFIDEVYLDSESDNIFNLASEVKCKHLKRDKSLASNKTDGHKLFYNEALHIDADIYIQVLATSPFIKPDTIKHGIEILKEYPEYDSVVLVKKEKQYLWDNNHQPIYDKIHIPNSVDLPDTIIETMGLYITRKEVALGKKMRFGDNVYFLEAEPLEAIDVNYPGDFELASYIAAGLREKERQLFKNLSTLLSSSMLSDILDDLEINGVIRGLKLNMPDKKILGRAKTLKLRKLQPNENYEGIYNALDSYLTIVPNDIIVVENECPEYAYFGDLNANMAIRSGAIGAIIAGHTRDFKAVKALDFPVFAQGYVCKDVRKRATVESINKKISLFGITVMPGDLIFADNDGIIVIPQKIEKLVIDKAFDVINKEKNVLTHITTGQSTSSILKNVGVF